jgi:uncharacterized membrane protein
MLQHLLNQESYFWLKVIATLSCGLIAGVFFAFSSFILTALARRPSAQGIAMMQSINIAVITPLFMLVFLGAGVLCLLLLVLTINKWDRSDSLYLLLGSLLYLFGVLGVTIGFNVPLNNKLANVVPNSSEAANQWAKYLTEWTICNHVRTLAALGATAVFAISLGR